MTPQSREAAERAIGQTLVDQWDPLGVRGDPARQDAYAEFAHDIYGLLARGASDVQIARHLHAIERDTFNRPELLERDLTPLVGTLRRLEAGL